MSRTRAVSHSFEASVHPECASKNIKRRALVPLDLLPGAPMGELMAEAALPVSRAPTNDVLSLLVVIDNLGDLADAYDSSLASVVSDVVHTRALSFCGTDAGIARLAADRFAVVTRKGLRFENVAAFAGAMTAIGGEPIRVFDIAVLAAVTVKILRPDVNRFDVAEAVAAHAKAVAERGGATWGRDYRADMAAAVAGVFALREGRLSLAYQPICRADQPDRVLYWEGLLRIAGADGRVQPAGASILAMERLRLVRQLDQWVVNRTIDELRTTPEICLGCNISARSAVLDDGWVSTIARLLKDTSIASRLILEVTETAPLPTNEQVRTFVDAMRSLGCRIAVDDFGAGNNSRHALTSLSLNFVKIDAGCLHRARVDARWQSCLSDLVGSAARLAETVIVEGIETPSDARLAREAGAQWLQGYLFGNPSSLRPPSSDPGVKAPCERGGVNGSTPTRA
ncbi:MULTISPECIES: EAL domain-containing protein [unclassified Bradyrhizobium]|uniref:EAL domain-containing protein n=1 Tax=unclassified Bradyrhizobium TaxID=2631580 RepID=UPI001FF73987|nr:MULTISPECIES: EAL domain-containing protein [unclassified Bradyrhizobium]MCK1708333.1 EAL domain-containing protein [Bradyrhizobium sp. 143]MCK1724185.1 EAL domain-containing protein [Bradyrhizobium sp. 142]